MTPLPKRDIAREEKKDRIRRVVFTARNRLPIHSVESLLLASTMEQTIKNIDDPEAIKRLMDRLPEDLRFLI